jgi:DNA-directed RNA polymerase subunit RPC12/RpoP
MTDFSITEDFPKTEIEFDQRFRDIDACYNYLASIKWPSGFVCEECGHKIYWLSSRYTYICTRCEHQYSLTAGTIMHSTKKTDHLLVQGHVVVYNAKIRSQRCQFTRTAWPWQLSIEVMGRSAHRGIETEYNCRTAL